VTALLLPAAGGVRFSVLLIDGDNDDREMYAARLAGEGLEIRQAATTDGALPLIPGTDVIVTGLLVPGSVRALELIDRVRRDPAGAATAIVVLTACDAPEMRDRASRAGASAFLSKPCCPEVLLAEVRRAVAAARRRHLPDERPVVLVVDDVEATRTGLAQLLQLRGFRTREAANGAEALETVREHRDVCAVVLDLGMPGTDGYWFREQQLRDPEIAGIPVIVFSASIEADQAHDLGIADVCHKPFSLDQLFEAVNRACAA
jgi:CheY-like chemotaxis protein